MSMEIDGAAILSALARDPGAFAMTKPQIDALAMMAVTARLKQRGLSLATLRAMAAAVGQRDFSTIIGGLPAKDAKALAKLDEKHPDYAKADQHWHRAQVIRLARGEAEPMPGATLVPRPATASKPAPETKQTAPKLPKIGKIMASEAQAAVGNVRKRRGRS